VEKGLGILDSSGRIWKENQELVSYVKIINCSVQDVEPMKLTTHIVIYVSWHNSEKMS
jgi:hypothetical protein